MALYIDLRDVQRNCRICLAKKNDLIPVDSSVFLVNDFTGLMVNMKILDIINLLMPDNTEVKVEYPTGVCCDCLSFVNETFKFKLKLETSTKILDDIQSVPQLGEVIETKSEEKTTEIRSKRKAAEMKSKVKATETNQKRKASEMTSEVKTPETRGKRKATERKTSETIRKRKATEVKSEDEKTPETMSEWNTTEVKSEDETPQTMSKWKTTEIKSEKKKNQEEKPHIEQVAGNMMKLENKRLHHCPICMAQLTALQLKKHIKTHATFEKYLAAPKLNNPKKKLVFYYLQKNTGPKPDPYMCPVCREPVPLKQFRTHIREHDNDNKFQCKFCKRTFGQMGYLMIHMTRKHKKEFPYQCEECGKGFVVKKNYECHILTHKGGEFLSHVCHNCGKKFANPIHLRRHLQTQMKNGSCFNTLQCKHCKVCFRSSEKMELHNCSNVKPYMPNTKSEQGRVLCPFCPKTFSRQSGAYLHKMKVHFNMTKVSLCQVCGISTPYLKMHMRKHNGERPYKCKICEKGFFTSQTLRQHVVIHTGEKPYACNICAKKFNNKNNLRMHEKIHKGDKPYLCHICDKRFLEMSYLKKHLRVHSQKIETENGNK